MEYGDRIFKLVQRIERNVNKDDLHSFTGHVKDGVVFVDARPGGMYIQQNYNDGTFENWVGTATSAANRLEMLKLDLDTVEI